MINKQVMSWFTLLYWALAFIFMVIDLIQAGPRGLMPFAPGPCTTPSWLAYLGLRAAADLMIIKGMWLILTSLLGDILTGIDSPRHPRQPALGASWPGRLWRSIRIHPRRESSSRNFEWDSTRRSQTGCSDSKEISNVQRNTQQTRNHIRRS